MKRNHKTAASGKASSRRQGNRLQQDEHRNGDSQSGFEENPPRNYRPGDSTLLFKERKRLFLVVGDEVTHIRYEEWGIGVVMECMTSSVPGGTCLARVRFQDGQLRCFNNDLDNESCCYYFGLRRYWNPTHGVDAIRSKFISRG